MKYLFLTGLMLLFPFFGFTSCKKIDNKKAVYSKIKDVENSKIKITANSKIFTATLLDNESAKAFKKLLPLTIKMNELNSNEKYYDFSESLPTKSTNPGTINSGELMLYGSKTLVLFYKTFSTSYSYTKLESIDDVEGLSAALGNDDVTVKFELD